MDTHSHKYIHIGSGSIDKNAYIHTTEVKYTHIKIERYKERVMQSHILICKSLLTHTHAQTHTQTHK